MSDYRKKLHVLPVILEELHTDAVVRSKSDGEVYVVTANYGNRVTAVRTVDITNPPEWERLVLL